VSSLLLTAADVAEPLGVPKSWVYEQSRRGQIPTVTLGRYRRYRREAIERWVEELEAAWEGVGRVAARRGLMTHREPRKPARRSRQSGMSVAP